MRDLYSFLAVDYNGKGCNIGTTMYSGIAVSLKLKMSSAKCAKQMVLTLQTSKLKEVVKIPKTKWGGSSLKVFKLIWALNNIQNIKPYRSTVKRYL